MSQTEALANVEYNGAIVPANEFGFTDNENDVEISNLELTQPSSPAVSDGATPGNYRDTESNQEFKGLEIVVLSALDGGGECDERVYFAPGSDLGSDPVCRSRDGKFPIMNDDRLVPQDGGKGCAGCEHSKWKKIGGKTIKPPCIESIKLIFAERNTGLLYRLNVKRTAIGPVKALLGTLKKYHRISASSGTPFPRHGFVMEMTSKKEKQGSYTFFLPVFSPPKGLQNPFEFHDLYRKVQAYKNRYNAIEVEADPVDAVVKSEAPAEYEAA